MKTKACNCGSGLNSWWEYDARGIPLNRVCQSCRDEKLKKFRPEVLSNSQYSHEEPIECD